MLQDMGSLYGNLMASRSARVTNTGGGIFSIHMTQDWFMGGVYNHDHYGMNFDPAAIARLNDGELGDLVTQIASAVGADPRKTSALLGNMDGLRESLKDLSPQQAKQLLDRAGEEKSREIYELIRKKGR